MIGNSGTYTQILNLTVYQVFSAASYLYSNTFQQAAHPPSWLNTQKNMIGFCLVVLGCRDIVDLSILTFR